MKKLFSFLAREGQTNSCCMSCVSQLFGLISLPKLQEELAIASLDDINHRTIIVRKGEKTICRHSLPPKGWPPRTHSKLWYVLRVLHTTLLCFYFTQAPNQLWMFFSLFSNVTYCIFFFFQPVTHPNEVLRILATVLVRRASFLPSSFKRALFTIVLPPFTSITDVASIPCCILRTCTYVCSTLEAPPSNLACNAKLTAIRVNKLLTLTRERERRSKLLITCHFVLVPYMCTKLT